MSSLENLLNWSILLLFKDYFLVLQFVPDKFKYILLKYNQYWLE